MVFKLNNQCPNIIARRSYGIEKVDNEHALTLAHLSVRLVPRSELPLSHPLLIVLLVTNRVLSFFLTIMVTLLLTLYSLLRS